jgi:hypothetical protein
MAVPMLLMPTEVAAVEASQFSELSRVVVRHVERSPSFVVERVEGSIGENRRTRLTANSLQGGKSELLRRKTRSRTQDERTAKSAFI